MTCENAELIWENDAGEGCFFETYGEQLEIVLAAIASRIARAI